MRVLLYLETVQVNAHQPLQILARSNSLWYPWLACPLKRISRDLTRACTKYSQWTDFKANSCSNLKLSVDKTSLRTSGIGKQHLTIPRSPMTLEAGSRCTLMASWFRTHLNPVVRDYSTILTRSRFRLVPRSNEINLKKMRVATRGTHLRLTWVQACSFKTKPNAAAVRASMASEPVITHRKRHLALQLNREALWTVSLCSPTVLNWNKSHPQGNQRRKPTRKSCSPHPGKAIPIQSV